MIFEKVLPSVYCLAQSCFVYFIKAELKSQYRLRNGQNPTYHPLKICCMIQHVKQKQRCWRQRQLKRGRTEGGCPRTVGRKITAYGGWAARQREWKEIYRYDNSSIKRKNLHRKEESILEGEDRRERPRLFWGVRRRDRVRHAFSVRQHKRSLCLSDAEEISRWAKKDKRRTKRNKRAGKVHEDADYRLFSCSRSLRAKNMQYVFGCLWNLK